MMRTQSHNTYKINFDHLILTDSKSSESAIKMIIILSILRLLRFSNAVSTDAPLSSPYYDPQPALIQEEDEQVENTIPWILNCLLNNTIGQLDKLNTATFMIYLIGTFGILYELSPGILFDVHGGKHSRLNHRLVQTYGTGVLSVIIMMYCFVLNEMTLEEAYQLSEIPWVIECLRNIWKEGQHNKRAVGYNKREQALRLAISAVFLYSMTQQHPVATMKAATTMSLLVGLYIILHPEAATKTLLGHFPTFDATSKLMIRMIGFNFLAHGGFTGSILFGEDSIDALTAFGIGYSSWFFKLLILQVITKDVAKAGIDGRMICFWIAVHGSVVATMLL